MNRMRGSVGAPGIAIGAIAQLPDLEPEAEVEPASAQDALQRFAQAQAQVAQHLQQLAVELHAGGNDAEATIFEAQALLAGDTALSSEVTRLVTQEALPLATAVLRASEGMASMLGSLDDAYLRERAADVRAVGEQIAATIRGASTTLDVPAGSILVARDLTPAQTATLRNAGIVGFATAGGTPTGHVAILARALGLPAIVGMGDALLEAPAGVPAILAADEGLLIVEPSADELAAYDSRRAGQVAAEQRRHALIDLPAVMTDGQRIGLWANIGHPDEARSALDLGAEGIGLFRTEFLFLHRTSPPDEEEQRVAYAAALNIMGDRPVVIRTLDIGGDKPIPYLPAMREANPFLGWRGIRFAMRFRDLFQIQLRALLRAATTSDLRIMLPMIATPDDVAWARQEIVTAAEALQAEGVPHRADVPLGIMVETPAAAITLDLLADGIRFCSIGSNDLTQYTLATDRSEGQLLQRYRHDNPAVFRMMRIVANDARRLGLEISVCGELAGEPQVAVALAGLGVEKLSMTPTALLAVKEAIRSVALADAKREARRACSDQRQPARQRTR